MAFKMDDYVDVAQRIADFYERFPDGSLRSGSDPTVLEVGGKFFIVYHAQAWRTPDDSCPSDGWAWEPIPGPTPYTKDSELMNAETSAWGRAIVALGFATKKIASAQEVRNRQQPQAKDPGEAGRVMDATSPASEPPPDDLSFAEQAQRAQERGAKATEEQKAKIADLIPILAKLHNSSSPKVTAALVNDYGPLADLSSVKADECIGKLERWKANAEKEKVA